ncbi:MAG: hypothetical protein AAF959_06475 [Cyanobacteria bacterium P01_D01_bin.56]
MNPPSSAPQTSSEPSSMWEDPIVAEVRQVREAYAATFDYDLQALFKDLKAQEAQRDRTFVSYPARLVEPPG